MGRCGGQGTESRPGAWRRCVILPGVIVETVQVAANEDLVGINVYNRARPSYRPALAFLGWLELCVPGVQLLVEKAPPMLVVFMVQERNLLVEENSMIHAGTILERGEVDQPLDVGDEFRADEVAIRAVDLLLENFLERARRAGYQIAHVGHLG